MYEWAAAIFVGLAGGAVNAILFGGGFALPRRTSGENNETIWDPGFLGTVLVSAAAAFLTWAYSTDASFSDQSLNVKPIAGALVAGIAGSRALTVLINRQYGAGTTEQTGSAAEDLASTVSNLSDELAKAHETEAKLREEIHGLKGELEKGGNSDK